MKTYVRRRTRTVDCLGVKVGSGLVDEQLDVYRVVSIQHNTLLKVQGLYCNTGNYRQGRIWDWHTSTYITFVRVFSINETQAIEMACSLTNRLPSWVLAGLKDRRV